MIRRTCLVFWIVLLATCSPTFTRNSPAQTTSESLKVSTADVLKFLGAHAWKWTYHAPAPYKHLSLRLVRFTRQSFGQFTRTEFSASKIGFPDARNDDEILIVCGNKNGHASFVVSYAGGTFGPDEQNNLLISNYERTGSGDGGPPEGMGSEQVLLCRYKNHNNTGHKEDLEEYVAVELEAE